MVVASQQLLGFDKEFVEDLLLPETGINKNTISIRTAS